MVHIQQAGIPCVAIIDDELAVREATASLLRSAGLRVASFASAEHFLRCVSAEGTGCLILDINLPGMNGLQLHQFLRGKGSRVPVIFMTGRADSAGRIRAQAMQDGAYALLIKPFLDEDLLDAVRAALGE